MANYIRDQVIPDKPVYLSEAVLSLHEFGQFFLWPMQIFYGRSFIYLTEKKRLQNLKVDNASSTLDSPNTDSNDYPWIATAISIAGFTFLLFFGLPGIISKSACMLASKQYRKMHDADEIQEQSDEPIGFADDGWTQRFNYEDEKPLVPIPCIRTSPPLEGAGVGNLERIYGCHHNAPVRFNITDGTYVLPTRPPIFHDLRLDRQGPNGPTTASYQKYEEFLRFEYKRDHYIRLFREMPPDDFDLEKFDPQEWDDLPILEFDITINKEEEYHLVFEEWPTDEELANFDPKEYRDRPELVACQVPLETCQCQEEEKSNNEASNIT